MNEQLTNLLHAVVFTFFCFAYSIGPTVPVQNELDM